MQTSAEIRPDKKTGGDTTNSLAKVGSVLSVKHQGQAFVLVCENASVAFQFINDYVLRVKVFRAPSLDLSSTQALVEQPEFLQPKYIAVQPGFETQTRALHLAIGTHPFSFKVENQFGEPVFTETSLEIDQNQHGRGIVCTASASAASHFYGLGEKTSFLDKRGECYTMWNSDVYAPHVPEIKALYASIPLLIHFCERHAVGVFVDNPSKTTFDMQSENNRYVFEAALGPLDCYIIDGPGLKNVVTRYTALTGRMKMPPKWALGYHQSRYSYMGEEEVLELAETFRSKAIPCDAIYLDIHYMDGYRVFTFNKQRFPNPARMVGRLSELGFHVVPIVDPGVKKDPHYPVYVDGIKNHRFCSSLEGQVFTGEVWPGESAFPDFTDVAVSKWWGEQHKFYTDLGIRGIWNDMNEPAVFNETKTMDADIIHKNNGNAATHDAIHNIYGMLMSKATYEGLSDLLQDERPFVLTRAGYAGIQRYAAMWTGDNRSFWEHLEMSIPMILNLGLSGIPFAGADIGGFAHNASPELLVRWLQVGVFLPFCRNHSALDAVRQEPWSFGPEVENICREYINLRYQWMPHLYSLFFEAAQTGLPVVRPLILEFPDDSEATNLCDEFMFGATILIAPILRPDATDRMVYLPQGTWYDYWSEKMYQGPCRIITHAPLHVLPIFIKTGSIRAEEAAFEHLYKSAGIEDPSRPGVAENSVTQYALEKRHADVIVTVYGGCAGQTSDYQLYEDDGLTFAYEDGQFNLMQFTFTESRDEASLQYAYMVHHYEAAKQSLFVRFKHLLFVPTHIDEYARVELASLANAQSGWCVDEASGDVVVKLDPETLDGMIKIS